MHACRFESVPHIFHVKSMKSMFGHFFLRIMLKYLAKISGKIFATREQISCLAINAKKIVH